MTRDQKIIHVANVLAVATADGEVSQAEALAMRDVLVRIGAGQAELDAARELLGSEAPYTLRPLDDPSEQMRNIEDMVLLALADGELLPPEAEPLEQFLSDLGYAQADMHLIVQRVRPRLRDLGRGAGPTPATRGRAFSPPPLLPSCRPGRAERNRPGATPASFEGHAGARRSRSPTPVVHTGRQSLKAAAARPAPAPAAAGPMPPTVAAPPVQAAPAPAAPQAAPPVSTATGPSRPSASAATDRPAGGNGVSPDEVAACVRRREHALHGACYCFGRPDAPLNPWACRLVRMPWSPGADWLRCGRFRDDDTFVFDRKEIAAQLAARLVPVTSCPYLLKGFADQALAVMPTRASTAGRWRHHPAPATGPGAVRVNLRSYRHGCQRTVPATVDGMSPTDERDALRMIHRTARRTAVDLDFALLDAGREAG